MQIKEGAIVFSKSVEIKKKADETDEEILAFASQELRAGNNEIIYSNIPITVLDEQVENVVPKIGDKKKLVSLSLRNAMELQNEKQILREGKKSKQLETLNILQKDLQLPALPVVIECFDNSNFQGTTPVASMVRFLNGKSDRKNYRHFNIKTVTGANDFASMKEVVGRRYKRIMEEAGQLPDLIMVDGGKGQLSSACEALKELGIYGKIPIVGIAKKLEEIYYPEDPIPLHINKKSPGLLLMQQIRDEAHRFAITFHRQKRSKSSIKTGIEDLHGIGRSTANKLLRHFKSVKKIREASFEEVEKLIGKKKAEIVKAPSSTGVGLQGSEGLDDGAMQDKPGND
jgi:excinuclease ABC subunit C